MAGSVDVAGSARVAGSAGVVLPVAVSASAEVPAASGAAGRSAAEAPAAGDPCPAAADPSPAPATSPATRWTAASWMVVGSVGAAGSVPGRPVACSAEAVTARAGRSRRSRRAGAVAAAGSGVGEPGSRGPQASGPGTPGGAIRRRLGERPPVSWSDSPGSFAPGHAFATRAASTKSLRSGWPSNSSGNNSGANPGCPGKSMPNISCVSRSCHDAPAKTPVAVGKAAKALERRVRTTRCSTAPGPRNAARWQATVKPDSSSSTAVRKSKKSNPCARKADSASIHCSAGTSNVGGPNPSSYETSTPRADVNAALTSSRQLTSRPGVESQDHARAAARSTSADRPPAHAASAQERQVPRRPDTARPATHERSSPAA